MTGPALATAGNLIHGAALTAALAASWQLARRAAAFHRAGTARLHHNDRKDTR